MANDLNQSPLPKNTNNLIKKEFGDKAKSLKNQSTVETNYTQKDFQYNIFVPKKEWKKTNQFA